MPTSGIRILVIGPSAPKLPYEDVQHITSTASIMGEIARFQPDVIMTTGFIPGVLNLAAFDIRKRWIHPPDDASVDAIVGAIEGCYRHTLWSVHPNQAHNPLVSVYTGTYNTGDYLRETYQSMLDQTYKNWEWIVVDDYSGDGTWERLQDLAKEDIRVRPFRSGKRLGKVGAVKDYATRLANGEYLVELDHDDMLTDYALEEIRKAFQANPAVGMVYSNCSNFFENGTFHQFNDEFWKNRYRETEYRGKKWTEALQPDIYDRFGPNYWDQFGYFLTVGPNHVRSFRASTLRELGGYNRHLPVADDWDLYARFFLRSQCLRIDRMLYLYRFRDGWANTTFTRNKSIQDHLQLGRNHYAGEFDAFNKKRLAPKTGGGETLLTIAVPAIPERMKTSLPAVMEELVRQAHGKPVEIMCALDNRARTLSEKRNQMIASAKGRFIAFVDDDDRVEPDYVDRILEAIRMEPDADCVLFDVLVHGYDPEPKVCKYDPSYQDRNDGACYQRRPNHVMAFRTEISRKHLYRADRSSVDEDFEWSRRATADVKKVARVDKVLYHYLYDRSATTQKLGQKDIVEAPSFVVLQAVNHDLTLRCLQSIRDHVMGAEIVLVANGVTPEKQAAEMADRVISLEENVGFAAGCNRGAMAVTRPLVCFMNDDAMFVDDTPWKLARAVSEETPVTAPYSNRAKPPQGDVPREKVPAEDQRIESVVGLCMMMPIALFRDIGGFDTRLLTWEDDAFCREVALRGKLCRIVGGAWVDHVRHASFVGLNINPETTIVLNRYRFEKLYPKIRVVAISKNEAGCIADFFRQFSGVTRDWCLLDTGSTDDTVRIAAEAGVRVERGEFHDFAQARNEALDRFSDGADWVIMLDPDERLDKHTIRHMRELLYNTAADILLAPLEALSPDGTRRKFVSKPFAFRANPELRWTFKVHEKLIGSHLQQIVENACILHVLDLHDKNRRSGSEGLYQKLMAQEPYFTDPNFRAMMREDWPILDYDRMEDPRIRSVYAGPLVSVVMPTYQRAQLLNRALGSVLTQDYLNVEAIVVGDACPELSKLMPFVHPRVRAFNLKRNHGAGGAVPRNYGILHGAGPLIAYLDDDNAWEPNHVSSLYKAMTDANADWAFSSMKAVDHVFRFSHPVKGKLDTSCVLHRRSLIDQHGWWRDRVEAGYAHDWEFFSRWLERPWVATGKPTLLYNAETSGQMEYLKELAKTDALGAAT